MLIVDDMECFPLFMPLDHHFRDGLTACQGRPDKYLWPLVNVFIAC